MGLLPLMICLPILAGLVLVFITPESFRKVVVVLTSVFVGVTSVLLAGKWYSGDPGAMPISAEAISQGMMVVEVLLSFYLIYVGVKHRRPLIVLMTIIQAGMLLAFEFQNGHGLHVENNLFPKIDEFSAIMALVIGIVGGLICIYGIGYMREFHESHPEFTDYRNRFFAELLVFLGAMFGIVFANNLIWIYFFWEITTLSSFLLIGYKRNEESVNNSLRALTMNLLGGVGFALGILLCYKTTGSIELDKLIATKQGLAIAPVALLCFAGITKSAQFPFSSWLLGAMVAPTPVSAMFALQHDGKSGCVSNRPACSGASRHQDGYCGCLGGCCDIPCGIVCCDWNERCQESPGLFHGGEPGLDRSVRWHWNL